LSNIPENPNAQEHDTSDKLLDSMLAEALPEPSLPAPLQQQILNMATTSLADRVLDWIIGDTHWGRLASAGVTMLFVGYLIGVSIPLSQGALYQEIDESGFADSFTAVSLLTLNEEYGDYDEQF